jgi:hypothetical protein
MDIDSILTNRFLRFIIPGILFFIFYFFVIRKHSSLSESVEKSRCENENSVKIQAINGLLTEKFTNKRGFRYIKFRNGSRTFLSEIFILEGSKTFDYLKVGDTINKKAGTLEMNVIRGGKRYPHLLYYGCKQ